MGDSEKQDLSSAAWKLSSKSRNKDFWVSGRLVFVEEKESRSETPPVEGPEKARKKVPGPDHKLMGFPVVADLKKIARRSDLEDPPKVWSLEELASQTVEGLDYHTVMNQLADLGPEGRVALFWRGRKLQRWEVFEEPRICKEVERGAVIHNLEQEPQDMSGWRIREFSIDSKGCLGEVCTRCMRVCPENAIHLRGEGASSFCEIDPAACKGCFLCWVECARKSADCIVVDGKVFNSELRSAHFGE